MAALGAVFYAHGVLRTRFFDDYLLTATTAGCAQVVLLAAGLDTRAYRLSWPADVHLFEVDLPDVLAFKQRVLASQNAQPRCAHAVVPADLRESWPDALASAGFQSTVSTAWLTEGLLVYLSADEATTLLDNIGTLSAPGSQLAFEHGGIAHDSVLRRAGAMPSMAEYTTLWKGGLGQDAPDLLTGRGWRVKIHDRATLAASLGRPDPDASTGGFLTAERLGNP
jgi:methyltransferase (TIGR00027 family)